ncbi:GNAT family N-acetyltransferase [Phreatobacter sp. AB_2022a]|uniref:GNAT family N-acetyltransferase n=1 Tax=Phreatobacter sp. AB_2022a TaxID=3003134 RepID=UPI00228700F8|nr:GNAT family N-acetyltransferase [Phreatobacter sp. AB_2022a]MCZ0736213.1 GNAT family N-acetyltransferase [Phreatobacter sp. AB_2022a]
MALVFQLRDFTGDDLADVARLWHDSARSIGLGLSSHPTVEAYRERLAGEEARSWRIRLAAADGRLAGFVAMQPSSCWLRQLFVAPALKGQGVGVALLDDAKREMHGGFWLRTDAENRRARRFYERHGLRLDRLAAHPDHGQMTARYVWP